MFLEVLLERNPRFVEAAIGLHRDGAIPANSYVLDLDTIEANAGGMHAEAAELGLTVYAMTKQVGRVPPFLAALRAGGISACVAVDPPCAYAVAAGGSQVGHVGHLVQIPRSQAQPIADLDPAHWTVFSQDKASEAAAAAHRRGQDQALLARIHADGDRFYRGHEGGFPAADIVEIAQRLDELEGAHFAGITTFPALLIDHERREVVPTPNLATLSKAAQRLRDSGYDDIQVNAPGTTSTTTLRTLADAGATQVEPGHGLTGTTPLHVYDRSLPELPATLYLTEVSHQHGDEAYAFGGGMYIDPVFGDYPVQALVTDEVSSDPDLRLPIEIPPPSTIDYYGMIDTSSRRVPTAATVILGFRIQAFVTRATIASVAGIASGQPKVVGLHDPAGREVAWP